LGNEAGFGLGEKPAASWLELAWDGEVGAPSALAGLCAPIGLGIFEGSSIGFLVLGLGGLSTFRDSPSTQTLFAVESWFMSRGTLHRGHKL
jgi:hypothetical protein